MNKFKWSVKRVPVVDISIRVHTNPWTQKEEPYAVVYTGSSDGEMSGKQFRKAAIPKKNTVMVFEEKLFRRIAIDREMSFQGEVRFGYGNTYLVATHVFDSLGIDVTDESSEHYEMWREEFLDDIPFGDLELNPPGIVD